MRAAITLLSGIRRKKRAIIACLAIWLFAVGLYQTIKPLPGGIDVRGREWLIPEDEVRFLYDLTYENRYGEIVHEQEIFNTVFDVIENARHYILIDMFLFNDQLGRITSPYRKLSGELTALLIKKKLEYPLIEIDFITDDINNVYGGAPSAELVSLREAGVNVIITNNNRIRDSNLLYSPFWRTFFQWFGNPERGGFLPHPFSPSGRKVTLRSYLTLLNFKANHRKIIIADSDGGLTALVLSANCHDASSAHSNVGIMMTGSICRELYDSEYAIASFSGKQLQDMIPYEENNDAPHPPDGNHVVVQALCGKAIKHEMIHLFDETDRGDSLSMAMFYLAERDVIRSLLDAGQRGVVVRIILDPSKDAFGYEKHGIPNRQVANELIRRSRGAVAIRWQNTHGEQFHTKLVHVRRKDGTSTVFAGSANLTRRNLRNYNLELDVKVAGFSGAACMVDAGNYFDRLWTNEAGHRYTLDYNRYEDTSVTRTILYRMYEYAGLSTF